MYTVNQLGKRFKLSRSTLLYYDRIGLLKPSARSEANYRLYNEKDLARLQQIMTYRDAGLSLQDIAGVLDSDINAATSKLEQRLASLNQDIARLRQQQVQIIQLLGKDSLIRQTKTMNKQQWVKILRASGMDDNAMHRWHQEFERDLPQVHTDFLMSLGIDVAEIDRIKVWSKET